MLCCVVVDTANDRFRFTIEHFRPSKTRVAIKIAFVGCHQDQWVLGDSWAVRWQRRVQHVLVLFSEGLGVPIGHLRRCRGYVIFFGNIEIVPLFQTPFSELVNTHTQF